MLDHTVPIRFKDGISQEAIDTAIDEMRRMKDIPAVRAVAAGPNVVPRGDGEWTHGLTLVFDSPAAMLEEFADHPIHRAVLRDHLPRFGRVAAMDVESR